METEYVLALSICMVIMLLYSVWKKYGDNNALLDCLLGRNDERTLVDLVLSWQLITDDESEPVEGNIHPEEDQYFGGMGTQQSPLSVQQAIDCEASEESDETSDENLIFGMAIK
jgi:hypothetical protein